MANAKYTYTVECSNTDHYRTDSALSLNKALQRLAVMAERVNKDLKLVESPYSHNIDYKMFEKEFRTKSMVKVGQIITNEFSSGRKVETSYNIYRYHRDNIPTINIKP